MLHLFDKSNQLTRHIFPFIVLLPPDNWRLDTLLLSQGKPLKSIPINYFSAMALFRLSRLSFLAIYTRSQTYTIKSISKHQS